MKKNKKLMKSNKYFFAVVFFIVSLNCPQAEALESKGADSYYPTSNMIVVEGGIIPQWSEETFVKNIAEFKEDKALGSYKYFLNPYIYNSRPSFQGKSVKPFMISNIETTWGEWKEVINWAKNNGYKNIEHTGMGAADDNPVIVNSEINAMIWCNAKSEMEGLEPVYKIKGRVYKDGPDEKRTSKSPYDRKLIRIPEIDKEANGYRLPTEIEWEWAAMGGVKSKNYLFSGGNKLSEVGWYDHNSQNTMLPIVYNSPRGPFRGGEGKENSIPAGTMPVAQKTPNELGIYDMSGNVSEYVSLFTEADPLSPHESVKGDSSIDGFPRGLGSRHDIDIGPNDRSFLKERTTRFYATFRFEDFNPPVQYKDWHRTLKRHSKYSSTKHHTDIPDITGLRVARNFQSN